MGVTLKGWLLSIMTLIALIDFLQALTAIPLLLIAPVMGFIARCVVDYIHAHIEQEVGKRFAEMESWQARRRPRVKRWQTILDEDRDEDELEPASSISEYQYQASLHVHTICSLTFCCSWRRRHPVMLMLMFLEYQCQASLRFHTLSSSNSRSWRWRYPTCLCSCFWLQSDPWSMNGRQLATTSKDNTEVRLRDFS